MSIYGRMKRRAARMKARVTGKLSSEEVSVLGSTKEFDLFFADDSRQTNPSRPGMNELVGIGGINVNATAIGTLNNELEAICEGAGFPEGEEFKWSPGRELWMRNNLVEDEREDFFLRVLAKLKEFEAIVCIVICDTAHGTATDAQTHELDVTRLFLERADQQCGYHHTKGMVVVDRPSGGRRDEDEFLRSCLETIQQGTDYVDMNNIIHNVVSTPSKLSRLIQSADLVTSASMAYTSGENNYSPRIFQEIKPLLQSDKRNNRTGGFGLKLHPSYRYRNLYHWLVDDKEYHRASSVFELPMSGYDYSESPLEA